MSWRLAPTSSRLTPKSAWCITPVNRGPVPVAGIRPPAPGSAINGERYRTSRMPTSASPCRMGSGRCSSGIGISYTISPYWARRYCSSGRARHASASSIADYDVMIANCARRPRPNGGRPNGAREVAEDDRVGRRGRVDPERDSAGEHPSGVLSTLYSRGDRLDEEERNKQGEHAAHLGAGTGLHLTRVVPARTTVRAVGMRIDWCIAPPRS